MKRETNAARLWRTVVWIWRLRPVPVSVAVGIAVGSSVAPVLQVAVLGKFVDAAAGVLSGRPWSPSVLYWIAAFAAVTLAVNITAAGLHWISLYLGETFETVSSGQIAQAAGGLPLSRFESPAHFDLLQRARVGSRQHLSQLILNLPLVFAGLLTAAGLVGYVGRDGWEFPVVFIVGVVPLMVLDGRYGRRRWRLSKERTPAERNLSYLEDLMSGQEASSEVRLQGLKKYLRDNWTAQFGQLSEERARAVRGAAFRGLIGQSYFPLTMLAIGVALVVKIRSGSLDIGAFAAFFAAVERFSMALWQITTSFGQVRADLPYAADVIEYLSVADAPAGPQPDRRLHRSVRLVPPRIAFEGVGFTYPGSTDACISEVSFTIEPGECVALVGENGAGKSTLAKLLLGFYEPATGRIEIDGTDLRDVPFDLWRRNVSAIFQDFIRFDRSIGENITYGDIETSGDPQRIEAAAATSGADKVAAGLPDKYETMLGNSFGEQNLDLSAGQWQKVALARAYLRDTSLVVLDEPTSALDPLAEDDVYRQFRRFAEGRSVLLISHRLGVTKLADKVLVLDRGRIVEAGQPATLLSSGGHYARMYDAQAQWYVR